MLDTQFFRKDLVLRRRISMLICTETKEYGFNIDVRFLNLKDVIDLRKFWRIRKFLPVYRIKKPNVSNSRR